MASSSIMVNKGSNGAKATEEIFHDAAQSPASFRDACDFDMEKTSNTPLPLCVVDEDFQAFSSSARSLNNDAGTVTTDNSNSQYHDAMSQSSHPKNIQHPNSTSNPQQEVIQESKESNSLSPKQDVNQRSRVEDSSEAESNGASGEAAAATEDTTAAEERNKKKRYVTPLDFQLLRVIGIGSFGKVLQVRNKKSNQVLAMKIISKRLLKRKVSYVENIQAERDILTKINHPFIVRMHCSFMTKEKLFIIMDFLAGGELFLRLGREGVFLEPTAAFYLGEIILALEHLHGLGILHRDLKPENILLSTDGHTCLTDFGLAKDLSEGHEGEIDENEWDGRARTICGTQEYMAPEMVARQGYGRAADFWSLGCIAYEMFSGKPPFESKKGAKDLFRKIMNERVKMPDGSSSAAHKLLKGLLNRNAQARLGAARGTMFETGGVAGLKQTPFFRGLDWKKLERKEIDPPTNFQVDHDEDLRHFHDEFVQMALPRSIAEMHEKDFVPRRCESSMFRGFSYVHHEFDLPERKEEEEEAYWNNVDDDGESLSECASSLGGGNNNETASTGPPPSEKSEKSAKKRPPRKKKNKAKAVTTPGRANFIAAEPAVSEISFDASSVVDEKQDLAPPSSSQLQPPASTVSSKAPPVSVKEASPAPAPAPVEAPFTPVQPKKKKEESWQSVKSSGKKSAAPKTTKKQNGPSSQTIRSKVPVAMQPPQVARAPPQRQQPVAPASSRETAPRAALSQAHAYRPAPGSWAAKMHQQPPRTVSSPQQKQQRQQQAASGTTVSALSPDWRKHTMTTQKFGSRSSMPQPPSLDSPSSMNDFPPPPIATNQYPALTTAKSAASVQGAWASRNRSNAR